VHITFVACRVATCFFKLSLLLTERITVRDVDLFVGVASIGNDPNWSDDGAAGHYRGYWYSYSFGDLSVTAQTRKAVLERVVPRLKIAERCSFGDSSKPR
jgi:hypothetical protein